MKLLALLISLILSLLGGDGGMVADPVPSESRHSVLATPSPDPAGERVCNREVCFAGVQGQTLATGGGSFCASVRNPHSGRRSSSQIRLLSRMVKGGKLMDMHHLHPLPAPSFVLPAGMGDIDRFLFSLCRLRL